MAKAKIIYGPAGCGKTYNAERIRKFFGAKAVVDDWTPDISLNEDTVYLTTGAILYPAYAKEKFDATYIAYTALMKEIENG